MSLFDKIDINNVPNHIAVIMDGNGRWAKERGLERFEGHRRGVDSVREVVEAATKANVKWLTMYAFSTENWQRPDDEVVSLMELMVKAISNETDNLNRNGVKLKYIGDLDRLPQNTRESIDNSVRDTESGDKMTLVVAISYSSRWEISKVLKNICSEVVNGAVEQENITEDVIDNYMKEDGVPDVDLLIRSGGDLRISNFLLWQVAYAELYFTPVFWPDFGEKELCEAILDFQKKERRFGKISEQLNI